ncbi:MAG TPA: hypothetical protein VGB77_00870 [Abditibacteriaceae bacterium]|jgi:hypothetical protein
MSEEINESKNETATEEASPLPFRVLWWRALIAMLVGGLCGWAIATFWCHTLGRLLFPSVFPNSPVLKAADMAVGFTPIASALLALVMVCSRGTVWLRAFASVIGVWLGCLVFFMGFVSSVAFTYFLLTKIPKSPNTPPLTATDLRFSLWAMIPMMISGGSVLLSVIKMHAGKNLHWFQTTKENIRENFLAVFKPNEKHRLERFVLQSPLSIEECRARLPQIADVETSPFAFWEKLPLPGFKPLTVRVESNRWRFSGRYRKSGFAFYVDLTEAENGTRFQCVSRLNAFFKYYSLVFNAIFLFMLALFVLIFCSEIVLMLFNQKPTSAGPFIGLLFMAVLGLFFSFFSRFNFSVSRQQELMVIEKLQEVLEAQIIEREPVRYKWGLFEQS